jgi:hypothetical protein
MDQAMKIVRSHARQAQPRGRAENAMALLAVLRIYFTSR